MEVSSTSQKKMFDCKVMLQSDTWEPNSHRESHLSPKLLHNFSKCQHILSGRDKTRQDSCIKQAGGTDSKFLESCTV